MDIISEISGSVIYFFKTFSAFLWPALISVFVFLLGIVLASFFRNLWQRLSLYLQIEKQFSKLSYYKELQKASDQLTLTNFVALVVWWSLVAAFSSAAIQLLGFDLSNPLIQISNYLPTLGRALFVILVGFLGAYLGYVLLLAIGTLIKLPFAELAGKLFAAIILSFTGFLLLEVLGVSQEFQRAIAFAIIAIVGLGGALALKEPMSNFIKKQL